MHPLRRRTTIRQSTSKHWIEVEQKEKKMQDWIPIFLDLHPSGLDSKILQTLKDDPDARKWISKTLVEGHVDIILTDPVEIFEIICHAMSSYDAHKLEKGEKTPIYFPPQQTETEPPKPAPPPMHTCTLLQPPAAPQGEGEGNGTSLPSTEGTPPVPTAATESAGTQISNPVTYRFRLIETPATGHNCGLYAICGVNTPAELIACERLKLIEHIETKQKRNEFSDLDYHAMSVSTSGNPISNSGESNLADSTKDRIFSAYYEQISRPMAFLDAFALQQYAEIAGGIVDNAPQGINLIIIHDDEKTQIADGIVTHTADSTFNRFTALRTVYIHSNNYTHFSGLTLLPLP